MLCFTAKSANMDLNDFFAGLYMKLNKWCNECKEQLTTETARKRKEVSCGYRNQCKECHNKNGRAKTKQKHCEICDKMGIYKGKRSLCSIKCRIKAYSTPNENGCWVWRNLWRDKDGYGWLFLNKKLHRAHRISYEIYNGPISDSLYVCHTCDNPPCVNPNHLWLGTNRDNQLDYQRKLKAGGNF